MHTAYIGLGSNLGESEDTLQQALNDISALPDTAVQQVSDFYRTSPVDSTGPDYINAVARLTTELSASDLLQALQDIELAHGRQRPYRNAPRTLDLDVLCYDDLRQDDPQLILPHPRMHLRAFVLRPLLDIAPDMILHNKPIAQWLADCADQAIALHSEYNDKPR
ncbi:2-amino-4-hydroxy-6-hydroxymethyldihydropteridine pyrophosphokinase [Advenella kashmirensis W13003]|uniref:2-amino-4-hydroxy-6-hydroxymethyldihydropteridine pyrophosphokinase n=1 Tax=Advenella kashmirensis W13003 TaxID=1424334 RepID=V8QMY4_9BURK|nr:2-amino-4-hydroxy-6-hydroxymethyldihydropteridine diphosphokinase [Advenella kashmirensis]ETF01341.1 2-amino-4-hydroxy-6-hydroxymethyldihydropteridine pyrophosphokinase [Advenella kashmirensis W13003]